MEKPTLTQADHPQESLKQSIPVAEQAVQLPSDESDREKRQDLEAMQSDYQRFFLKTQPKKSNPLPVDKYPLNRLVAIGTAKGRLLCRVRKVVIEGSDESVRLQARKTRKGDIIDPAAGKYWYKRYYFFEKYDQGIRLDKQAWFSVTPQAVAEHVAARLKGEHTVLDGFCGAGGDSIQLSKTCKHVIANDIKSLQIALLQNNAQVYGARNITTSNCDFLKLNYPNGKIEAIYMSPPWGGPDYFTRPSIGPLDMEPPLDQIIQKALSMSDNLALLLSCNMDLQLLAECISETLGDETPFQTCTMVVEKIFYLGRMKFLLVLFGRTVTKINEGEELNYVYQMLAQGQANFPHKALVKYIKQKYGMPFLLNSLFRCEAYLFKDKKTLYERFVAYLRHHHFITTEQLETFSQPEKQAIASQSKREVKQRKMQELKQAQEKKQESRKPKVVISLLDSDEEEQNIVENPGFIKQGNKKQNDHNNLQEFGKKILE